MTGTVSPYPAYSDERLLRAREHVRARVLLAERNLERVLAHEEQAQAATVSVRQHLARAKGDERLIAAILSERENIFQEEEGERILLDKGDVGHCLYSMPCPESSPAPRLSTSPESLCQRLRSRSAYR